MSSSRPVIVAAFANRYAPTRSGHLRELHKERESVEKELQGIAANCDLVTIPDASLATVCDKLYEHRDRVTVFHFAGHADGFHLMMEQPDGGEHLADGKEFANMLAALPSLKLVFLNGCATEDHAMRLTAMGVPLVIATTQRIDDGVARQVAELFYRGLARGYNVEQAYKDATQTIRLVKDSQPRKCYIGVDNDAQIAANDRWPWQIYPPDHSRLARAWNIPEASGSPLFGLAPREQQSLPSRPYRYLEPFDRNDYEIFFGRGAETRAIVTRLLSATDPPVLLIHGQTGAGKSSLINAGVIPFLESTEQEREREDDNRTMHVCWQRCRADQDLVAALEAALVGKGSVAERWKQASDKANGRKVLVILDQVEEAISVDDQVGAKRLAELAEVLAGLFLNQTQFPPGKIVLGFRKEWFSDIEAALESRDIPMYDFFLRRLSTENVVEAIEGVARIKGEDETQWDSNAPRWRLFAKYKLTVEPGLAQRIASDLAADTTSPLAPTLQVVLARMWDAAKPTDGSGERLFHRNLYDELGTKQALLQQFFKTQLQHVSDSASLEESKAVNAGLLLDVLQYHTTDIGTSAARVHDELAMNYGDRKTIVNGLIGRCVERHLLVNESTNPRQPRTRLSHDTLAPLVQQEFNRSDQDGQRARKLIEPLAKNIDPNDPPLLTKRQFELVNAGLLGMRSLAPDEQAILDHSKEAFRRQRRRVRQRIILSAVAGVMIGLAFIVSWLYNRGVRIATENENYLASIGDVQLSRLDAMSQWLTSDRKYLVPKVRELLDSEDDNTRFQAAYLLLSTDKPDASVLLEQINHANDEKLDYIVAGLRKVSSFDETRQKVEELSARLDHDRQQGFITAQTWELIKFTAVMLRCGLANDIVDEWYAPAPDPNMRTFAELRIEQWMGPDLEEAVTYSREQEFDHLYAMLCRPLNKTWPLSSQSLYDSIASDSSASGRFAVLGILDHGAASGEDWKRERFDVDGTAFDLSFVRVRFDRSSDQVLSDIDRQEARESEQPFELSCCPGDAIEYWISATEVPRDLYAAFTDAVESGSVDEPFVSETVGYHRDDAEGQYPARGVKWKETLGFCNWLTTVSAVSEQRCYSTEDGRMKVDPSKAGFRLATRNEWEWACRARSDARFSFGDSRLEDLLDDPLFARHYAWTGRVAGGKVREIARLHPNVWGIFDMEGNVAECVWASPQTVPPEEVDPYTITLRSGVRACGGAFNDSDEDSTSDKVSIRGSTSPDLDLGLRLVQTIEFKTVATNPNSRGSNE